MYKNVFIKFKQENSNNTKKNMIIEFIKNHSKTIIIITGFMIFIGSAFFLFFIYKKSFK